MESRIALHRPSNFSRPNLDSSKALFYRSHKNNRAHIILLQSLSRDGNLAVHHYRVEQNSFSLTHFRVSTRHPLLAHVIPGVQHKHLLTMITDQNQFCALDLDTSKLIRNYQAIDTGSQPYAYGDIAYLSVLILISAICAYVYNDLYQTTLSTILIFGFAHYIGTFARWVERDIKCTIPGLQNLRHIVSCAVPSGNAIYFVGSDLERSSGNSTQLKCLKFDTHAHRFGQLQSIDVRSNTNVEAYQMLYVEAMQSLILFTNTEHIFYFPLTNDTANAEWKHFEGVVLPEIPGPRCSLQATVAFKGIIFLFYQPNDDDDDQVTDQITEVRVYCWDLIFSGDFYETDDDAFQGGNALRDCLVVNTDTNWCHFVGTKFHCKFDLAEEIPASLSISHLQIYHWVIKHYSIECAPHVVLTSDMEMLILDYFPFFL